MISFNNVIGFFGKEFIYLSLEGEGRKNNNVWEKYQLATLRMCPDRDLAGKPGTCPDQESNQWPLGVWDNAQLIGPHQSGLKFSDQIFKNICPCLSFLEHLPHYNIPLLWKILFWK